MRTFEGIEIPQGDNWSNLFAHFLGLDDHRKMPTIAWQKQTKELIAHIGEQAFIDLGLQWLLKCIEKSTINQRNMKLGLARSNEKITDTLLGENALGYGKEHPKWLVEVYGNNARVGGFFPAKAHVMNNSSNYFYYSFGGRILRGFIHAASVVHNKELLFLVDRFATTNPNECADALHVYSQLPMQEGVPRISRIRAKIKKKNIQSKVDNALKDIAKRLKLTPDRVEEISISDYDLNNNNELIRKIGDFEAIFKIETYKKTNLSWKDTKGKVQASVPSKVKTDFATEFKDLKAEIKEIESLLPVQRERIEAFFLKSRNWIYEDWFGLYISHPLVGVVGKQLIWHFDNGTQKAQGIWNGQCFVDANHQILDWISDKTEVQLWHPIGFSAEYIVAWRNYLINQEITQPFKQAFREIYIVTDAELNTQTYSNRFAGHILNREHLGALCRARTWSVTGNPTRKVPAWNIKAEYWINEVWLGQNSDALYGSAHTATDQVRFYKGTEQLEMHDVPAIVFSELMRDIDLFVGVTSIANDPNWQDRGEDATRNYWRQYAFGDLTESSKIREETLRNLIPKLKIASKCSFEGKFLIVKGKIRTYKIHLGSGNIMMMPNDQYLCIVADASKTKTNDKLYLPFDGDNMLSIILSKAMLLADDDKITDTSITRQINS